MFWSNFVMNSERCPVFSSLFDSSFHVMLISYRRGILCKIRGNLKKLNLVNVNSKIEHIKTAG